MTSDYPALHPLDHLPLFGRRDVIALRVGRVNFSYADLEENVGRVAGALLSLGLSAGDRVASWLPKTGLACLLPLAAARAGLVHVPINAALKPAQTRHILADSGASLLVAQTARIGLLQSSIGKACLLMTEDALLDRASTSHPLSPSSAAPESLCALLYTSGSTGRPKGVMLSHANLVLGAVSVAQYLGISETDRVLAILPLSFDYGQNQLFSTWIAGGEVVALNYLTGRDAAKAVADHRITTIAGIPPLWTQLCETEWPPETARMLRRLTNSGGALTEPLVQQMQRTFPEAALVPMYGLTEAFRSTYLPPDLVNAHPTSMGRAIPFAEVHVVNADGLEAATGEVGELVHGGPLVAQGYWHHPEATAARFRPAPCWFQYGGRAVWSGDLVRQDAEGLFYFVGRADAMIKTLGNRVSPTEVEEAALSLPLISEALAFGIPDAAKGEAIILCVRGQDAGRSILEKQLKAILPGFMQPSQILWRDSFPRNANGKLDRLAVRAAYLEGAL